MRTARRVLAADALYTCATIFERNAFERILTISLKGNGRFSCSFSRKATIRFVAAAGASAMTEAVWKGNRSVFSLIIRPAVEGLLDVVITAWEEPSEAEEFVRIEFPEFYKMMNDDLYLQEVKKVVGLTKTFLLAPRTEWE